MVNAYQPKVSLLEKLAKILNHLYTPECLDWTTGIEEDPEVLEWYDRMAELKHVPDRLGVPSQKEVVDSFNRAAFSQGEFTGYLLPNVGQVAINDAIEPREGYQIFATKSVNHEAEDVCSYTEATSPEEAMKRCLEQFAGDEYFNHGVKNIETQVVTYHKRKTALSLD